MWTDFLDKITARRQHSPDVLLRLNPRLADLPLPIQRYDDPFLPFGKAIINATRQHVCGYMLDMAAYLALGAAGMVALERTIGVIGLDIPKILHGPFAGQDFSPAFERTAFDIDAVTLVDAGDLAHYLTNAPGAAFVVEDDMSMVAPERGGLLLPNADKQISNRLVFRDRNADVITLRITGDDVLYAGRGDNFVESTVKALESYT